MKQKQSVEGSTAQIAKPSIKKVGTMLGAGAIAVIAIGAIGVFGLNNMSHTIETQGETKAATTTSVATTTTIEEQDGVTSSATLTWWKAGVDDYDFVEDVKDTTTVAKATTTKIEKETAEATTTTKATTKKSVTVDDITDISMYTTTDVNLRDGTSTDCDKIVTISQGKKVTATAKASNGWYKVEYNGNKGYISGDYLTKTAPATTKATTTKAATTTTAKQTTPATTQSSSVISYTDEEFEMFCYVLQGEVGNCSEASKIAVANVIINRVKSTYFPNTIKAVLTANNQFTAISYYYSKTNAPSENTRACALRALQGEDNSSGATFYYSIKHCSSSSAAWFETLNFCMELEGQRFFKN